VLCLLICVQETIKEFELNMSDMVATFVENIQALTAKCRELENQHHEQVMEICDRLLGKVVKSELSDELTEELQEVDCPHSLHCKNSMQDYLNGSFLSQSNSVMLALRPNFVALALQ